MVSIIIPTYNRADLLEKSLESVVKQIDIKYEIIIIDDCSRDTTIKNIARKYSAIYLRNQKKFGAQYSRNKGVEVAKYDYIAFLDSDDIWESNNKLQIQYNILKKNPNVSIVYTNLIYIDENDNILFWSNDNTNGVIENHIDKILNKDIIGTFSSVMVRKKDFIKAGKCDVKLPARQDWDLWIRMSTLGKLYRLNSIYTKYRIHKYQISSNINKKILGYSLLLLKHHPLYNKHKKAYFFNLIKLCLLSKFSNIDVPYKCDFEDRNMLFYKTADIAALIGSKTCKSSVFQHFCKKNLSNFYLFKGMQI